MHTHLVHYSIITGAILCTLKAEYSITHFAHQKVFERELTTSCSHHQAGILAVTTWLMPATHHSRAEFQVRPLDHSFGILLFIGWEPSWSCPGCHCMPARSSSSSWQLPQCSLAVKRLYSISIHLIRERRCLLITGRWTCESVYSFWSVVRTPLEFLWIEE